jgi:hypothetical protein
MGDQRRIVATLTAHDGGPCIDVLRQWLGVEARYLWRSVGRAASGVVRGSFRAAGLIEPEQQDYHPPVIPTQAGAVREDSREKRRN